ncbi:galactose-1-epimerase [Pedobacter yulinensis]|uniref:Aldose 1-epimerase n=1 Tax=Pedobacter yulinensis TaxID=2126353 RepID=A0A2T3HKB9_9SPHI|nr:aldose epimerase family protein [Pedobacter yulinensis]PST82874.1 galactose-1-epimerase [Pedobacter yulinensis]
MKQLYIFVFLLAVGTAVRAQASSSSSSAQKPYFLTIGNKRGMSVTICNFGARITSLVVPGKDGRPVDVVLGFNTPEEYTQPKAKYYGPVVGRFGNRIAKGIFSLGGRTYTLSRNNGPNSLHGGRKGFSDVYWQARKTDSRTVELSYVSPDGEEGYPGTLRVTIVYKVGHDNRLDVVYYATTDQATVLNLTNHSYFNLNGSGDAMAHKLWMNAAAYTPVNKDLIPDGPIATVTGTPFDFTAEKTIGTDIDAENEQLRYGQGYDHNFVLSKKVMTGSQPALRLTGDKSGVVMSIWTDQPGMQFYSGNFFQGRTELRSGARDVYRGGLALEPQHFPDAPNRPDFPTTVLNPGKRYAHRSSYRFSIDKSH